MKKFSSLLIVLLLMLTSFTAGVEYQRGDVDQDGNVSISDVTCLIDYLLSGSWNDEPVTPPDNHEWVDLGLPSGTLWATCNVGASSPEQYGTYFAWGETAPKGYYDWSTYKWCNGSDASLTKYCTSGSYGYKSFVDNKTELDPEDDAAYVNWGPSWRMPTPQQQNELRNNCSSTWTTVNGVSGRLFTGPNGNTLFLPAAGDRYNSSVNFAGSNGLYWSRLLISIRPNCAHYLDFGSSWDYWHGESRCYGRTVRAVRVP